MNDESMFWIAITGIVLIFILGVTSVSISYWESKAKIIAEMVENGEDPIRAACSLELGNSNIRECILEVAKK